VSAAAALLLATLVAAAVAPSAADEPSSADGTPTSIDVAPRSADGTPTSVDVAPRSADGTPTSVDVAPGSADGISASRNFAPSSADVTPSAVDVAPRSATGTPTSADVAPRSADVTPTTHATDGAPIPLRDFVRPPEYDDAKLSPDGAYLAVSMRRDGQNTLAVLKLDTLDVASVVRFNRPNDVYQFEWANDRRLLVSLAITYGALDYPAATGELYAVDADGGAGKMIFGRRAGERDSSPLVGGAERFDGSHRIMRLLPDDPQHVLVSTFRDNHGREQVTQAAMLDVYTGQLREVAQAPLRDAYLLADRSGAVRFAVGRNADFAFEVHYRVDDKHRWQRLATDAFGDGELIPIAFADARHVYVTDNRTTDTRGLFVLDLESGKTEPLFRDPRVDINRIEIAEPSGVAYAARYVPSATAYYVFGEAQPYADALRAAIERFGDASIDITSFTRDGRRALVCVVTDRNPGAFYLYDANQRTFTYLLARRRWLDPARLAPVRAVDITARDGQTLQGFLTRPVDARNAGPLIVMVHGGPHGVVDDPLFDETAQLFAHHGYGVLKVNYRGSSGYGRTFQSAGFGQWGGVIQRDIADGARWAIAAGIADPQRIAIYGESFGAYAAVMNALLEPDLYRCAVGVSGVYNVPLMFEAGDVRRRTMGLAYLRAALGDDPAALVAISPVQNAARIRVPIFLAHGGADVRSPIVHARQLRDALTALGKPVEYLEEPNEAHGFYDVDHRVELYERALAFFDRYTALH
jgi:dipeptidyl aminopeptidase/acylaminoacyl peptidase